MAAEYSSLLESKVSWPFNSSPFNLLNGWAERGGRGGTVLKKEYIMFRTRNRGYWPWESLGEHIARLNNEFSRAISHGMRESERSFPAFNIWSNAEGAILNAELPGVKVEDIELTVSGNVVAIKGNRKNSIAGSDKYVRRERQEGEFIRTFELPFQVDPEKVVAKSAKGILRLELPRAEADKPRKIAVRSA